MARQRRKFNSGKVYEVIFRARKGLPLPQTKYMTFLLEGIIARVQRNQKVLLHHYLFMSNHAHIIITVKDARAATNFYGEIKKQLTEAIKKLLGLPQLNLWSHSSVIRLKNIKDVINRIAYIYANPTAADLEDSIELYPGLSSWELFQTVSPAVNAQTTSQKDWVRLPLIPRLRTRSVTKRIDQHFTDKLKEAATKKHTLVIEPNSWMRCFRISSPDEVREINQGIIRKLRDVEAGHRARRAKDGKRVLGALRLRETPLMQDFTPKKKSRAIFVICEDKKERISYIKEFQEFCATCRLAFQAWKNGEVLLPWPPGAFRPPMCPTASLVEYGY